MHGIVRTVLALVVGILIALFFAAGCGHESFFRDEVPPPISGDVVVIGDSIAALVAALEAAREGAVVLVFYNETNEDRWYWNQGAVAALEDLEITGTEPAESEEKNLKELLREALSGYSAGRGEGWYFSLLARRAGPDLAWLGRETGVNMVWESSFRYRPDNLSLAQAYERLTGAALVEGVRFFPGTTVEELIMDEGEKGVAGVRFRSTTGTLREAYAPAVILADGGFLGNPDLMEELAPAVNVADWRSSQAGQGWQLALSAGLDLVEANLFAYAPAVEENNGWVKAEWPDGTLLIVDDRIIPLQDHSPGQLVMELFSSSDLTGYLLVAEAYLPPGRELDWPRYAGVDAFLEAYRLDLPYLRSWFAQPWGYFRGRPVHAVAEYCLGGIAVNEQGAVLRGSEPLPGLYAAGEITGGLHGWSLMPGAALAGDLVFGRHVGGEAAAVTRR